jgi:hypothetical protein
METAMDMVTVEETETGTTAGMAMEMGMAAEMGIMESKGLE